MEEIAKTKNKLPNNVKQFFYKLSNYLDTDLFFYGSVQRYDYLPDNSDIDVAIFTENEYSTMVKLQHFLHVERKDFKKFVLMDNDEMVDGYKIKYKNEDLNLNAEFSIYNNKYEEIRKNKLSRHSDMPFYISIVLYILKILHYKLYIISTKTYNKYKNSMIHGGMGENKPVFILLK